VKYAIVLALSTVCWLAAFWLWRMNITELPVWRSLAGALVFYFGVCITQTL
jgi:hypothetical protein